MALDEPQEKDTRFDVDGVSIAVPPDAAALLRMYDDPTLDHDPGGGRAAEFFVRYGRRLG